jgi:hypothetical protein
VADPSTWTGPTRFLVSGRPVYPRPAPPPVYGEGDGPGFYAAGFYAASFYPASGDGSGSGTGPTPPDPVDRYVSFIGSTSPVLMR